MKTISAAPAASRPAAAHRVVCSLSDSRPVAASSAQVSSVPDAGTTAPAGVTAAGGAGTAEAGGGFSAGGRAARTVTVVQKMRCFS
ncbi:hypothetical protein [Paenarthrobacter sp. A20]|uniref:hypothetical protein n=1 Tax=Paenarthrobacter sp. A20 TaxID=2817891 RepID=UPI00209D1E6A|nr:hypothetical protein [Paenarthrobacter sp. A20]MCP1412729.1 ABC-type methionine transport system permease subunit [Paenarthrobacter sp. A20]